MKKIILVFIFSIFSFSAHALMLVEDPAAIFKLGLQLKELKSQSEYLERELRNLKKDQTNWSNAQELINQLGQVVNKTNSLAYSAEDASRRFEEAYPGYQPPQNFSKQYRDNVNMTQRTLNGVLSSMGTNAKDFENENARLKKMQDASQNAEGQLQAIQAATQISSEMVSQLQILRQTVIAQTNAQTAYFATKIQTEANAHAELSDTISNGSTKIPEYGSSGHYLIVPRIKE